MNTPNLEDSDKVDPSSHSTSTTGASLTSQERRKRTWARFKKEMDLTQIHEEEPDFYVKFNPIAGWQTLLLLQFLPQMKILILMFIYFWYAVAVYMVAFAFGCPVTEIPMHADELTTSFLYAGDILYFSEWISMVVFKNVSWRDHNIRYQQRHGFVLFIEMLSLIPYELIYEILVVPNMRIYYCLRMRYVLRLIRLYVYYKHGRQYVGTFASFIYLVMYVAILALLVITASGIHYVHYCAGSCSYASADVLSSVFWSALVAVSTAGTSVQWWSLLYSPYFSLGFFFVTLSFTSFYACDVYQALLPRFYLISRNHRCQRRIEQWRGCMEWGPYYVNYQRLVEEYGQICKAKIDGIMPVYEERKLPEILYDDLALDTSWVALKHTHFFSSTDVFFMRAIAKVMTHKFLCPGEVVFKKNTIKESLVYIVAGNLDVLSEEDGETATISFTTGTCLGESTLVFSYPSVSTVISRDVCDVVVLKRADLIKLANLYPKQIRKLFERTMLRYKRARTFRYVTEYKQRNMTFAQQRTGVLSLKWLKATLRRLLYDDEMKASDYYSREVLYEMEERIYCMRYLNLLVQSDYTGMTIDTTFIRTKFPIVFRPESLLIKFWNACILVHVLILTIMFPILFVYSVGSKLAYLLFGLYITAIWLLDIYVRISTAVYTKFVKCITVSDIVMYRFGQVDFILDIVAAMPFELAVYFLKGRTTKLQLIIGLSNRLLKVYRFDSFFINMQSSKAGFVSLVYVKYTFYYLVICYYVAAAFKLLGDFESNADDYAKYLASFSADTVLERIYYTYALALGFSRYCCFFKFPFSTKVDTVIPMTVISICFEIFYFIVIGNTSATETMRRVDEHATEEFLSNVEDTIEIYGLEKYVKDRIMKYIDMHTSAQGYSFLFEGNLFKHLPKDLFAISKGISPGMRLKNHQFFNYLDDRILNAIAAAGSVDLILEEETFRPYGELCEDIFVLLNGFCLVECSSGKSKTVGPGELFSLLEAAFNLKSCLHITSLTTCRIFSIKFSLLKQIMFKFPQEYGHLMDTINYFRYWEELETVAKKRTNYAFVKRTVNLSKVTESLKRFPYDHKKRTPAYYEYYYGFYRKVRFMQYFLLRVCFHCGGAFVFYWELCHCVCVVCYIIVVFMSMLTGPRQLHWYGIRIFFESLGLVDIYLRHHFTYYNNDNIEIAHPFKTCTYYWKHAFALDVFSWFPFEWFIDTSGTNGLVWRANRLLQLYRPFGFVSFAINRQRRVRGCWKLLTYAPFVFLIINFAGYVSLMLLCERTADRFECLPNSWLDRMNSDSHVETYLYNLLFIIIILTGGNSTIQLQTSIEMNIFTVFTLTEFILTMVFTSKMVAAHLAINRDLCIYQEAMQHLVSFMHFSKIDKALKWETIKHFEYLWDNVKTKSIATTFSEFKSYFKGDLLYNIYEKTFQNSTIFVGANENFFKLLLEFAKHQLYLKTGTIYSVNDVSSYIYILVKGKVEMVGADLNRLETLRVGSIFGNLDMIDKGRRTLSAVTSSHVEVLKMSSNQFYRELRKFPDMFKHFRKLTRFHVDYIQETNVTPHLHKNIIAYRVPSEILDILFKRQQHKTCPRRVFKRNALICFFEDYFMNVIYLLQYGTELINISVATGLQILVYLYLCDLLYIFKVYLKLHTSYDDEYGRTIMIHRMIYKRYKEQRFGFYFDLFTIIPFELLSFSIYGFDSFLVVFSLLRANRIPRVLLAVIHYHNMTQKLNVNVTFVRFRFLFVWVVLVQMTLTFILQLVDEPFFLGYETSIYRFFYRYYGTVINTFRRMTTDYEIIHVSVSRLCVLILILFTSSMLAIVLIAECCAIIVLITHTSTMYTHFVLHVFRYMKTENVSLPLRSRIECYVDLLWTYRHGVQYPELLKIAPAYLREGILYSMFGHHLMNDPVLMHCHMDLTRQMCSHMTTLLFFPGDNIAYVGDIDRCMYFVQEGEVHALSEDTINSEVVEMVLKDGDMFGLEQGLYPRKGHEYTYKCVKYTYVVVLCRDNWIYLLDFFPATKRMIYDEEKAKN